MPGSRPSNTRERTNARGKSENEVGRAIVAHPVAAAYSSLRSESACACRRAECPSSRAPGSGRQRSYCASPTRTRAHRAALSAANASLRAGPRCAAARLVRARSARKLA